MINIKRYINSLIKRAYDTHIGAPINEKYISAVYYGNHGIDYCVKTLIPLGKALGKTPKDLYDILIAYLGEFETTFDRDSININLKPEFIIRYLDLNVNVQPHQPSLKILVDYSSPNIAKDMHVGHLRSTIIGDSICNLFELFGHNIMRINHIGDFGTQFGMIIQHLLEICPNYRTVDLNISDLQKFYAESKKRFDTDEEFANRAYNKVVLLQHGDQSVSDAWEFIKEISRKSYESIYERLNIHGLIECGESFYQPFIPDVIQELEEKGILIEEDGRKIIKIKQFPEVPLTIVKSDGAYTYDTTDIAALKYRLVTLNMDKIIYVTDNGQHNHFEMCFKVAEMMGWKRDNQELIHVGFGLVQGLDGKKLKSRAGDTIKLMELLDESINESRKVKLALQEEREKRGDIKINMTPEEEEVIIKNIAYSSIKYADLASMRTNDYKFSYQKMLSLKGNSGSYLLYEYTRIASILRNAGEHVQLISDGPLNITEKEEINVCKQLLLFPEIIESISDDLMFHKLCGYLYNLTNAFSCFHTNCRCLQYNEKKELIGANLSRLTICLITKKILEKSFNILGIIPVEKM